MVNQSYKEILWWAATPGLMVSKALGRRRFSNGRGLRLNLGSGPQDKYLQGFQSIDINPFRRPDLWLDVRKGLPFSDGSVAFIYSCYMFEHLNADDVVKVLRECYCVLESEGTIRIVVPDLGEAIAAYVNRDHAWFYDWPHSWKSRGGRFMNYIILDGQHKIAYDYDFLAELLLSTNFCDVKPATLGQSSSPSHYWPDLAECETKFLDNKGLFVEAHKK